MGRGAQIKCRRFYWVRFGRILVRLSISCQACNELVAEYNEQLDNLMTIRRKARIELLAESRKHPATHLLQGIPRVGPIRAALLIALLQTPHLQKGTQPDSYMLTDMEGSGPKTIGVVSSTANLAPHIGHKIEVTGVAVPASQAEAEKNVPKAEHYMRLSGISRWFPRLALLPS